jgi:hypothetical protein
MAQMPHFAHLMFLLLMGSELAVTVGLLIALGAAIARRKFIALLSGGAAVGVALGYACLLFGVGWISGEKTLAPGQWKYFCEADCHIAYSIESVQPEDAASTAQSGSPAGDVRIAVRLKTWFDQNTIASFRGNGTLTPEPRRVVLIDGNGAQYSPLPAAGSASSTPPSTQMTQPLRPGESYTTRLVFQVPREATGFRLLITDVAPVSRFVIDHENSPFHGKIFLRLPESAAAPNPHSGQASKRAIHQTQVGGVA